MNADGSNRRELATIDDRQGQAAWAPDGRAIYFTAQERGNVRLYRQPVAGGKPELVIGDRGSVGAFSVAKSGAIAYTFAESARHGGALSSQWREFETTTDLNTDLLGGKQIADVESFTFVSNDNKYDVEAFLVKPLGHDGRLRNIR